MTAAGRARPEGRGSFADEAFAAAAGVFASASRSWEQAVPAAIAVLFDFLAASADRTEACMTADGGDGADALARRDRLVERFAALLEPGFGVTDHPPAPIVAEAISGGIYELVRDHVLERRIDELPLAAPNASVVALAPFVGASSASQLAESESVQADR